MAKLNFRQFLRLYGIYAKMDLAWLLRDKLFAVTAILSDFLSNIAAITGVFLLACKFGGIGGMNQYEVLLMLAYTTLVTAIFQTFFAGNNTGHISRRIGRGQMEHMFLQPLSLPAQLLTEGFIPFSGSSNLVSGTVILCIAATHLGISLTWWWILSLIGNLIVTTVILLGSSYLAASLTFYAPVQTEEISTYILDTQSSLSVFPLSGMPLVLQLPLLTILPSGLLGWFPTLVLLGKPPLGFSGAYPIIFALALSAAAAYFFRKGLHHYVKKGINRYLPYGHRR